MRRFNDPYSRHIPESSMTVRQRGIRGEMIGIGVVLKRTWKYSELGRAVVELFLSSRDTDAAVGKTVLTSGSTSSNRFESTGNVLSNFIGRFNRNVLGSSGHNPMQNLTSLIQHICVTLHTVTPFLLSATCHRMVSPRVLAKFPRSIRGIQMFGICVGALQVFSKITPVLCPIEVDSLQSGGPSIFSGVEIGDQIHLIDGRTVNNLSLSKVNELLNSGNVGDIVSLGIIRNSFTAAPCRLSNEVGTGDMQNQDESGYIRQDASSTLGAGHKNKLKKDSSSKNRRNRVYLTLGVMKDNVFAGKVSSSILSYTESFQKTKYSGNLVASAGSLVGGDVTVGRGGIGYISIKEFTQRTVLELETAFDKIRTLLAVADVAKDSQSRNSKYRNGSRANTELSALVIDLRGNLGGTLPSALDAAALFLPYGKPLLQMKRTATVTSTPVTKYHDLNTPHNSTSFFTPRRRISGTISRMLRNMNVIGSLTRTIRLSRMNRREIYYSTCNHADVTTPLLLLVDSQTASASEIFASALIDNSRAVSVGSRTVGKNVAQVCIKSLYFQEYTSIDIHLHIQSQTDIYLLNA